MYRLVFTRFISEKKSVTPLSFWAFLSEEIHYLTVPQKKNCLKPIEWRIFARTSSKQASPRNSWTHLFTWYSVAAETKMVKDSAEQELRHSCETCWCLKRWVFLSENWQMFTYAREKWRLTSFANPAALHLAHRQLQSSNFRELSIKAKFCPASSCELIFKYPHGSLFICSDLQAICLNCESSQVTAKIRWPR